jgi:predicted nucleic acid-binding protein
MRTRPRVYIETSIVSYLTARPTRDVVRSAHQRLTRRWWRDRSGFELFASELVLREAAAGDRSAATRRLRVLAQLEILGLPDRADQLALRLVLRGAVPQRAAADALHVAVAAVHGMNYLLTWNCQHIANATIRARIEGVCREAGFEPPIISTPEELVAEK